MEGLAEALSLVDVVCLSDLAFGFGEVGSPGSEVSPSEGTRMENVPDKGVPKGGDPKEGVPKEGVPNEGVPIECVSSEIDCGVPTSTALSMSG